MVSTSWADPVTASSTDQVIGMMTYGCKDGGVHAAVCRDTLHINRAA